MQEEIDNKSIALTVSASKLTGRVFMAAIRKYAEHRAKKSAAKREIIPHGKQSVKQLIGQNQGVSTIESNDTHIKDFDKIAGKYGVDYAIKKVKTEDKPKYILFFKARDADAITLAFTEYTSKSFAKQAKKSLRKKLHETERITDKSRLLPEKTKTRGNIR